MTYDIIATTTKKARALQQQIDRLQNSQRSTSAAQPKRLTTPQSRAAAAHSKGLIPPLETATPFPYFGPDYDRVPPGCTVHPYTSEYYKRGR
jgi:hypothetical protein